MVGVSVAFPQLISVSLELLVLLSQVKRTTTNFNSPTRHPTPIPYVYFVETEAKSPVTPFDTLPFM